MHILQITSLMFADAIRFQDIAYPQFCSRPDAKNKKSDDYVESKGVRLSWRLGFEVQHISALCYCPPPRADGALPPHTSGRKAMDLLDVHSPARFCCMHCRRLNCFQGLSYSDSFMTATILLRPLLQRQILSPR